MSRGDIQTIFFRVKDIVKEGAAIFYESLLQDVSAVPKFKGEIYSNKDASSFLVKLASIIRIDDQIGSGIALGENSLRIATAIAHTIRINVGPKLKT